MHCTCKLRCPVIDSVAARLESALELSGSASSRSANAQQTVQYTHTYETNYGPKANKRIRAEYAESFALRIDHPPSSSGTANRRKARAELHVLHCAVPCSDLGIRASILFYCVYSDPKLDTFGARRSRKRRAEEEDTDADADADAPRAASRRVLRLVSLRFVSRLDIRSARQRQRRRRERRRKW